MTLYNNVVEEYEPAYTESQWEAIQERKWKERAARRQKRWDERHEQEREKRTYFCNQKFIGIIMVVIVLFLTVLSGNLAYLALILPGTGIIFTKRMVVVNDYYWTHSDNEQ